jgi:hypothetical protein
VHALKVVWKGFRFGSCQSIVTQVALVGGEWPVSRPGRFMPGERTPGTHLIGWVGPRAGLNDTETLQFYILPGHELLPLGRAAISRMRYTMP